MIALEGAAIPAGDLALSGDLSVPAGAKGIVVFAHGSGSGRFSPRNRYVGGVLSGKGFATLLLDLLTPEEEAIDLQTARFRFDVERLAGRLMAASRWLESRSETRDLAVGFFGASTGAGAALIAAAELGDKVGAVVSRGGRPDLAAAALERVTAPTLLIVGGEDFPVINLNREALARLRCTKKMEIVPGATHLFEEPGALERVAALAADWFEGHLRRATSREGAKS
jgi:putative phosphoribosyl transferase